MVVSVIKLASSGVGAVILHKFPPMYRRPELAMWAAAAVTNFSSCLSLLHTHACSGLNGATAALRVTLQDGGR